MGGKYFIPLPIRVKAPIERLTSFMTFLKLRRRRNEKKKSKTRASMAINRFKIEPWR
jgi:hypothetical protein